MARLDALPSIDIIHGFKGILDFYLWKGLPCVRSWPRMSKAKQTEGTKAAAALFGRISTDYRTLAPLVLQAFQEAAKDQPRTARDLYISAVYGHLHERTEPPPPPPPEVEMYDAYICLRDVKGLGQAGGTFTSDAWRTRTLNNEQADTKDICSLAANQFTLPAGSYHCSISCPAYEVANHQTRLQNITTAATLLLGSVEYARDGYRHQTRSFIVGRFTLAAENTLEVQHRCGNSETNVGFGYPFGRTNEVYTLVEIRRETPPA